MLLQPYSFFEGLTISMSDNYDGISFDFKLNYILVFLGFSKLFIILRVVLTNTIYMSPRCTISHIKQVDFVGCMAVKVIISTQLSVFLKILLCYL